MFVLSRKRDESINIGDDIIITIVDIRGDKVRIGVSAPTQTPVHRKEVYDNIKQNGPLKPGFSINNQEQRYDTRRPQPASPDRNRNEGPIQSLTERINRAKRQQDRSGS